MTYTGEVRNGQIVLENGVQLPEGTRVRVEPVRAGKRARSGHRRATVGQRLMKFAGIVHDLPSDMVRNHDHYLHGHPKK